MRAPVPLQMQFWTLVSNCVMLGPNLDSLQEQHMLLQSYIAPLKKLLCVFLVFRVIFFLVCFAF